MAQANLILFYGLHFSCPRFPFFFICFHSLLREVRNEFYYN